jgi:putative YhbY family RNA-binding protein
MKNSTNKALTAEQRRALRAKAHPLHPVVLIGDKGLSEAVLQEIDVGLRSHELIKIRAQSEREQREVWLNEICLRLSAQPVQHIGKVLVIYRERPPDAAAAPVVRAARAKPASGLSKRAADRARARSSGARAPATTRARPRARTR